MSSVAQINANRANAALSTGPVTSAGIENCKYNATKHGLTGKQIVIKGEDPAAYDALRSSLIAELKPAGEHEAMLVEEIAQNWWRLERARRTESQMLDRLDLAASMTDRAFLNLQRYMSRIERCHTRARTDLAKLQALRKRDEAEALKAAVIRSFAEKARAPLPTWREERDRIRSVMSAGDAYDSETAGSAVLSL